MGPRDLRADSCLAVLQPSYLPWLGYFEQIYRCNYFVYYDDVQFDKNGWRNRNRIKTPTGLQWLTVPVTKSGGKTLINETQINNNTNWRQKHIKSIYQNYSKAPYFDLYFPDIENILSKQRAHLVDLNIEIIGMICNWLKIDRPMARASELDVGGDRNERLINLCRHYQCNVYYSGDAARDYIDVDLFLNHGVEVHWQNYKHPVYSQLHGDFVPYASVIDLLMNEGEKSLDVLTRCHDEAGMDT